MQKERGLALLLRAIIGSGHGDSLAETSPARTTVESLATDGMFMDHFANAGDLGVTFCATLCDEWASLGVTDVVLSPGSRSTPLAIAVLRNERLNVHMVLDERSAGFVALGLGKSSGVPAALMCTSGRPQRSTTQRSSRRTSRPSRCWWSRRIDRPSCRVLGRHRRSTSGISLAPPFVGTANPARRSHRWVSAGDTWHGMHLLER